MAGLVKLQRGIGRIRQCLLWAGHDEERFAACAKSIRDAMVIMGSDRSFEGCRGDCRQAATRNAKGWALLILAFKKSELDL
jgi:hypothetical protein